MRTTLSGQIVVAISGSLLLAASGLANEATNAPRLDPNAIAIGQRGYLGRQFTIQSVLDKKSAIVWFWAQPRRPTENEQIEVIVTEFDTSRLADGSVVKDRLFFDVKGTQKLGASTYFTLQVTKQTAEELADEKAAEERARRNSTEGRAQAAREAKIKAAEDAAKAKSAQVAKRKAARETDEEGTAASLLKMAKQVLESNPERGKQRLQEIISRYPGTTAAKEAAELLKD